MTRTLAQAMQAVRIQPTNDLAADILRVVALRKKRTLQMRVSGYAIISITSFAAIIPATVGIFRQLATTGFFRYLSLATSDGPALAGYWKQFAITLVEALPVASLTILLALVFVFGWSLRKTTRNTYALNLVRA